MIICNGTVITNGSAGVIAEGAVVVQGGEIVAVGKMRDIIPAYLREKRLDARGGVIMPGFINAHSHIYSIFARGFAPNPSSDFTGQLKNLWWRVDGGIDEQDIRLAARYSFIQMIKNGVTTVFDHHAGYGGVDGSLIAMAQEAQNIGIRFSGCFEVSDRNGYEAMYAAVRENRNLFDYVRSDRRLAACFGLHASFTLSDATMDYIAKRAPQDCGYHVHVAEDRADERDCMFNHGKRVVHRLADYGILGEKTIAVHSVFADESELCRLAETDTFVVHNPQSNMGNGIGVADLSAMLNSGVTVGLGTDGYTYDMLESLKVTGMAQRLRTGSPSDFYGADMSMLMGANAELVRRHFGANVGVLEVGAAADIITLDYDAPTPINNDTAEGHIRFGLNGSLVRNTVAGGKLIYNDGVMQDIDTAQVAAQTAERATKLWARI